MLYWRDLQPGDTVIELDGNKAVFVIAKKGTIETETCFHWDVVVLSSNHPNNHNLTAFRSNWVRANKIRAKRAELPPNHQVVRRGEVIFTS